MLKRQNTEFNLVTARILGSSMLKLTDRREKPHISFLKFLSFPIHSFSEFVHWIIPCTKSKHFTHFIIGLCIMLVGATLASMKPSGINSTIWEAWSWGIHGLGAAPCVTIILKKFGLD